MARGLAEGARGLSSLSFTKDGAEHYLALVLDQLELLASAFPSEPGNAGIRFDDVTALDELIGKGSKLAQIASAKIGAGARPVRVIAFDKSAETNWALGWHQDRTICVKRRADVPGFGPWTTEQGLQHVQPPFSVTEAMATVRIHLDPVDHDNAPLLIAARSHRRGLIREMAIGEVVEASELHPCHAEPGDVWLYATAILHASERAVQPTRRRVHQIDDSASNLPAPLEWQLD